VTIGTWALVTFGKAAFVAPEVAGPIMATTLSLVAKLAATVAALLLSDLLSFEMISICFPRTPPAANQHGFPAGGFHSNC